MNMNAKKRVNGSWVDAPYYIHKTAADTFTTLPVDVYADGNNATVGLKGNTTQSGTPTSHNPIMPKGCGERTANLYPLDASKLHVGRIENDGTIDYEIGTLTVEPGSVTYEANEAWRGFYTDFIQVNEKEKLTFSSTNSTTMALSCSCYDENDNFLGKATAQSTASTRTFTLLTGTKKVRVSVTSSDTTYTILRPMLNSGSTPLPYEPYGYKIPVVTSADGTEPIITPIYLGEVETTRKIKKLVLTGEETWFLYSSNNVHQFYTQDMAIGGVASSSAYSTIAPYGMTANNRNGNYGCYTVTKGDEIAFQMYGSKADFPAQTEWKTYLAAQYAAGTPVTVWYVLATPEIGIVNEPLMKIGNYADEVSNISIPTITGKNIVDVETVLKPSEVSFNYAGWHTAVVHKRINGAWD